MILNEGNILILLFSKFFQFHAFLCIFDIFGEHFHSSYHFTMTPPFMVFWKISTAVWVSYQLKYWLKSKKFPKFFNFGGVVFLNLVVLSKNCQNFFPKCNRSHPGIFVRIEHPLDKISWCWAQWKSCWNVLIGDFSSSMYVILVILGTINKVRTQVVGPLGEYEVY